MFLGFSLSLSTFSVRASLSVSGTYFNLSKSPWTKTTARDDRRRQREWMPRTKQVCTKFMFSSSLHWTLCVIYVESTRFHLTSALGSSFGRQKSIQKSRIAHAIYVVDVRTIRESIFIYGAPHRAHVRRKMCNYSTATFSLLRAFYIIPFFFRSFFGSCSLHTFALVFFDALAGAEKLVKCVTHSTESTCHSLSVS